MLWFTVHWVHPGRRCTHLEQLGLWLQEHVTVLTSLQEREQCLDQTPKQQPAQGSFPGSTLDSLVTIPKVPQLPKTVPPAGDQLIRQMSWWETLYIQPITEKCSDWRWWLRKEEVLIQGCIIRLSLKQLKGFHSANAFEGVNFFSLSTDNDHKGHTRVTHAHCSHTCAGCSVSLAGFP